MRRGALRSVDPQVAPTLGASRARVLRVLQTAGAPVGSAEIAHQTGLHPNTARFHLDALVAAGLVKRTVERREAPGRPRALFESVVEDALMERRDYRLLAEILSDHLGRQNRNPRRAAVGAGEAWGRSLTRRTNPRRRVGEAAAIRVLTDVLDEVGFAPEATGTARTRQVLLHHCPFRELAHEHRDVVCGVHLGLMRGVLAELGSSITAERLEPFVEPSLCVTSLSKPERSRGRGRLGAGERSGNAALPTRQ